MEASSPTPKHNRVALGAGCGFGVAFAAAIASLIAGLGTRWGWWDYRTAFVILRFAAWAALAAAVISLIALAFAARHRLWRSTVESSPHWSRHQAP